MRALVEINTLYRCHDRLLAHKQAVFDHLTGRWRDLFNARFEVLLYDLTSTYFEADPPFPEGDKRRHGYSRDHRPDCERIEAQYGKAECVWLGSRRAHRRNSFADAHLRSAGVIGKGSRRRSRDGERAWAAQAASL